MSSTLETAYQYAKLGWHVIPLHYPIDPDTCSCPKGKQCGKSNGKHPIPPNGLKAAQTDTDIIDLWFGNTPDANLGIVTGRVSGFFVLDVDPQHGGAISLDYLTSQHGPLPDTVEAQTGSGGRHLLFRYPAGRKIGNRVGFREGLDIRGDGGYIVAPPSRHRCGGEYAWEFSSHPGTPMADAPPWLLDMIDPPQPAPAPPAVPPKAVAASQTPLEGWPAPIGARDRARAYLAACGPAIEGHGGDAHTFKVAGNLLAFGLSEAEAYDLMDGEWNASCSPPWEPDDLRRKIASAARNGTPRQPKTDGTPLPRFDDPQPRKLKIRSSTTINPEIAEPPTIIDGLLRRGEIANIVSSPKMRKSWAMADLAFCATHGLPWLGHFKCKPSRVLLIDNELREWQLQDRFAKMRQKRGIKDEAQFDFVALRDDGGMDVNAICDSLALEQGYDLIILDALYRFFPEGFDENSNADFSRLYNTLDKLTRSTGAAIVVVHHTSKGDQSGKATTDTGSGAGAQSRAADAHIVLRAVKDKDQPQNDAPDHATLSAVVRYFKPVPPLPLVWDFPFWRATNPATPEAAERKKQLSMAEWADTYAREVWESRETIEQRAREAGQSRTDARNSFAGSFAEGYISCQTGARNAKTYKLTNPDNRPF